jgi:hypothetical protein
VIYVAPVRRRRIPFLEIALVLAFVFCAFAMLVVFASGFGVYGTIAGIICLLGLLAVRWPTATAVAFIAFTPFNRFVIMIVYHYSHSLLLTKGLQLWKEAILGAILARVVFDLLLTPQRKHRLVPLDILALFFVLISLVYLVYPGTLDSTLSSRLQGFRADTVLVLAYFAGRGLNLDRQRLRWLMLAIVPGAIAVAVVAVFQFVEPGAANRLFESLGYSDFVHYQGDIGDAIATRNRDLPGAESLPRASSLILGDLALAFFQVVTVALAAALFYLSRNLRLMLLNGAFLGLMFVTLVMTLSRSAMASVAASIALAAIAARATGRLVLLGLVGLVIAGVIVLSGYIKVSTIEAMVNLNDASSLKHVLAFDESINLIVQSPLGRGLGTAGNIGQQEQGGAGITNESWYLQIGTEMGILGMAVYLGLVLVTMILALLQFFKVRDFWLRTVTLTVATAACSMLVLGNFLHAWENTPLSIVFWLMAGIAIRARSVETSREYARAS